MKKVKWKSDGCTLFPDQVLTAAGRLCCCYHDEGFVVNGDFIDRWYNDLNFFYCLRAAAREYARENGASKSKAWVLHSLCPTMWLAVRFGGMPLWYLRRLNNASS
jgi:hypothetical protein